MNTSKILDFIYAQKFRFELGKELFPLVNFALLVVTASAALKVALGIPAWLFVPVLIVVVFTGVWAFGWFLDSKLKSRQRDNLEQLKRSPFYEEAKESWAEIISRLERIEAKL